MVLRMRAGVSVYGGYTLSRDENHGIIFIKGALPDELVDVTIEEKKKDYSIARVVEVIEPSVWRVKPVCEVYGICGGCQLQHADYNYQLNIKIEVLREILRRMAKLEIEIIPVRPSRPFNYRYRAQFKIDRSGVGFYKEGSRTLVPLTSCPLMIDKINSLLPVLEKLSRFKYLREVHISSNGSENIVYLKGLNYSEEAIKLLNDTFTGIKFENKNYGAEYISLFLDGIHYTVSGKGFFQSNWELNQEMVRRVSELLNRRAGRLLEFYAGAGNFSIPFSKIVSEVTAVEENPDAFNDFKRNISLNGIKNCRAINSQVERYKPSGHYDVVLVDPPRPGLTDRALTRILEVGPDEIFYISCNPSTLARDIKKFSGRYEVQSIEMFDLFPNTYHIETLTILKKRS